MTTPVVAIPWYKSRIIQGVLTIVVTQVVKRVQAKYNVDVTVWGTAVPDVVGAAMDGLSSAAAWWAVHARSSPKVPIPPVVTLTQAGADQVNTAAGVTPKDPSA
jgi:hypothetical protein